MSTAPAATPGRKAPPEAMERTHKPVLLPTDSSFDLYMRGDVFANNTASDTLPNPPFADLPMCECSLSFLRWAQHTFPNLLESTSNEQLQAAVVTLTKEYQYRKPPGGTARHPLNRCLPDLYKSLLAAIRERQEELRRHPPKNTNITPRLYIGQEKE